jgi:hypothetical protein
LGVEQHLRDDLNFFVTVAVFLHSLACQFLKFFNRYFHNFLLECFAR